MRHGKSLRVIHCILWPFIWSQILVASPNYQLKKNINQTLRKYKIPKSSSRKLIMHEVVTHTEVTSTEKKQSMDFYVSGLHKSKCRKAMRKLSKYESYSHFIDFVKRSHYDEKTKKIDLLLDSKLLPVAMTLRFKLPRIKDAGVYKFSFEEGFFKGLKGQIILHEVNHKCLFITKAFWHGKHTGFPDTLIEFFSGALSKISMNTLFRVSHY